MSAATVPHQLWEQIDAWRKAGERVALATLVKVYGSAPQGLGAKMAISAGGSMVGSVSGGCVEGAVVQSALTVLEGGPPQLVAYGIDDDWARGVGLACGGAIEVFINELPAPGENDYATLLHAAQRNKQPAVLITALAGPYPGKTLLLTDGEPAAGGLLELLNDDELTAVMRQSMVLQPARMQLYDHDLFFDVYRPPKRLFIIGAVHTAIALVGFARTLGFETYVLDARGAFATPERFPHAHHLLVGWPGDTLAQLDLDASSYVVVLTHDAKIDNPALIQALAGPARYIGALGSLRTHAARSDELRRLGAADEQIARIHAPIGLDLGGRRPEEIALAIMAEIVSVENQSQPIE
ncbi:MAG: XdhC family protein [Caldilineaceae bacterium]|nr:XdhC family protein [Caldilineaceae bacterium]